MADQWFYSRNQQQLGPVSRQQLTDLLRTGQVAVADLVWTEGMAEWTPAARAFAGAIGSTPSAGSIPTARPAPADPSVRSAGEDAAVAETLSYSGGNTHQPVLLTSQAIDILRRTQGWTRFIAVLIFIGAGFTLLASFGGMVAAGVRSDELVAIVIVLVFSLLYIVPAMHLWRYSSRISGLVAAPREDRLEEALDSQRAFWRFIGIVTLVVMALWVGVVAIAAVFAAVW